MKAEVITIGDEILIGQTIDTNSAWIAKQLNGIGVELIQITSIMDRKEPICNALREASSRADLILLTGGLGPTRDDITKICLAEYFNSRLILNHHALENIQTRFAKRGIELLDINRDQALIPDNCTYIPNNKGTAPGMMFKTEGKVYVSMPGVPYEMKAMMTDYIIPELTNLSRGKHIVHSTITVVNIPESTLSKTIEDIELALPPYIKLAYLPHLNLVRLRLTGRSAEKSKAVLSGELEREMEKIKERLGDEWFEGEQDLSQIVGNLLRKSLMTIGTVESCTGGFIAHCLTRIPGASAYYQGSMLTYSNRLKMEKLQVPKERLETVGSVSEEVAVQMAKAAREQLKVDYCISTTGIAGPSGATDIKPVGLVYIGLALPDGRVLVKKNLLHGSRTQIIEKTANVALNWLREILTETVRSQNEQIPARQLRNNL